MTPSIVVLMDFSPAADTALRYATGIAEALAARIVLLHLYQDPLLVSETAMVSVPVEAYYNSQQEVGGYLRTVAQRLPVPTEVEVSSDTIPATIAENIQRHHPLLLVVGREHTTNFLERLVSNLALPTLQALRYPLLVVPERLSHAPLPARVIVAADAQPFRLTSASLATQPFFEGLHTTPTVVHVAEPDELSVAPAQLALNTVRGCGLFYAVPDTALYAVQHDDPAEGILQAAAELQAQAVVVLARPHSFLGGLFHRSVTAHVLRDSTLPVLVLPTE